jgi:hypothetical protein
MFRPYHREDKPSAEVASTSRQFQHMFRLIALAVAVMGIVSCVHLLSHEEAVDRLGKASNCCESITQFRYDQLTEGKGVKFNLNET